jgi:acyl-CoA thioester hydrolase
VVSAELSFLRPARFEDLLTVTARCTNVGRSSFHLDVDVSRDDEPVAGIRLVYVNVDAAAATSRPLPDGVARALSASISLTTPTEEPA